MTSLPTQQPKQKIDPYADQLLESLTLSAMASNTPQVQVSPDPLAPVSLDDDEFPQDDDYEDDDFV